MSISSARAAVTAAGGTPTQYTHVGLLKELVTALGGSPTKHTVKELLEQAITAAGGTPTQHSIVGLQREFITAVGGSPVGYTRDELDAEIAALTFFAPSQLFGGADQGFVFDFTDISTLFQTTDTSSPVTAAGQSIGRANDLSGKGNHATQGTSGARPTYQGYAAFDGSTDFISTPVVDLSASDKATIIASYRSDAGGNKVLVQMGAFAGSGSLEVNAGAALTGVLNSGGTAQVATTAPAVGEDAVATTLLDMAGVTTADEVKVRHNGVLTAQTPIGGPAGTGNLDGTHSLHLGSNSAAAFLNGRIYRAILINRTLSGSELADAESWCAAGAGVSL